MTYQDLGYNDTLANYRVEHDLSGFEVGRVISEHKDRYIVKTPEHVFEAETIGNLRFTAETRYDLPAVGDWVAFSEYDEGKALIHAVFPRSSILERQAVGKKGQVQIIATNIDCGLIVQAVDRDFNLNRLERYATICNASHIESLIVLSKVDLISEEELELIVQQVRQRIKGVTVIPVSNQTSQGYSQINALLKPGKSFCLLGSSGVGKSTLLNGLSGKSQMKTGSISSSVNKGRHITSHRELTVLDSGGIVIDNPGMREVGIADTALGLETTFETILEISQDCRFNDCTHIHEMGCAILEALEDGQIDEDAYANFQKMEREKAYFESTSREKKKKDKDLGKLIKEVKKRRKRDKY